MRKRKKDLKLLFMHAWDLDGYCHNMETGNTHLDWSKISNPMKRLKRTRRSLNLDGLGLERKTPQKKQKKQKNHTVTQNKHLIYGMTGLVLCIMGLVIRSSLIA